VCRPTTTTGETTAKIVKLWHSDKVLRLLGGTGILFGKREVVEAVKVVLLVPCARVMKIKT
jgi:hypothetical protein